MTRVAVDTNVLVGAFDSADSLYARSRASLERLEAERHSISFIDVVIGELLSVLVKRAKERKSAANRPDIAAAIDTVAAWYELGEISFTSDMIELEYGHILAELRRHKPEINFNDAFLVLLHERGAFDELLTFDESLAAVLGSHARTA